jgi:hypothetical protein
MLDKIVFDSSKLTAEQKLVAQECIDIAKAAGNEIAAAFIESQFRVIDFPKVDIQSSPFVNLIQQNGMFLKEVGSEYREGMELPVVMLTAPIDKLDELLERLVS